MLGLQEEEDRISIWKCKQKSLMIVYKYERNQDKINVNMTPGVSRVQDILGTDWAMRQDSHYQKVR